LQHCLLRLFEGFEEFWLGVRDDFRNWVSLGFQPAKRHENPSSGTMATGWSGEIDLTSGAVEAEQLSGPERA
jgi:hypothetical protein